MTFLLFVSLFFNPVVANDVTPSFNAGKACIANAYQPFPVFSYHCQPCGPFYAPDCYHNNFAFDDNVSRYIRDRHAYINTQYRAYLERVFGSLEDSKQCIDAYMQDAYDAVQARVDEAHANRVICDY